MCDVGEGRHGPRETVECGGWWDVNGDAQAGQGGREREMSASMRGTWSRARRIGVMTSKIQVARYLQLPTLPSYGGQRTRSPL